MKRRILYNLIAVAVLLTALGADYLASAATVVRAEAVVEVAGRMASRFTRAFPRRVNESAIHVERGVPDIGERPIEQVCQTRKAPLPTHGRLQLLYLPPPLA